MATRRDVLKGLVGFSGIAAANGTTLSVGKKYHDAKYWHVSSGKVFCDLCPVGCVLTRGNRDMP